MIRSIALLAALAWAVLAPPSAARDLSAFARLEAGGSSIAETGAAGTEITLVLSQPVPWRLFTVDDPPRLVLDFRALSFDAGLPEAAGLVSGLASGASGDGWSRLVVTLTGPAEVVAAGMTTASGGRATLGVTLRPTDAEAFALTARAPAPAAKAPRAAEKLRPVIVLDPGHGGLDPGAEAGGLDEKSLMLAFALELEEALIRGGLFDVALTRRADEFVPLETRISRARAAGADAFLSLHADELPEGAGAASGITVYTLAAEATDDASRRLAERHDKNDLLAGVDVAAPGDEIALVLMDLARTDTAPRSVALASTLEGAFRAGGLPLVGRPLRSASFSVLKAPDIPSVLIELGFLSSPTDRARLTAPAWRATAVSAIEAALLEWALDDAARAGLRRQ